MVSKVWPAVQLFATSCIPLHSSPSRFAAVGGPPETLGSPVGPPDSDCLLFAGLESPHLQMPFSSVWFEFATYGYKNTYHNVKLILERN